MTRRESESNLRYLRNPPPMSMEAALASENATYEISIRVTGSIEEFTPAERIFWEASYFLGDTLNGGLIQTLYNDTGSLIEPVHKFVSAYCNSELDELFSDLKKTFPESKIPRSRERRCRIIDRMSKRLELDPFDELTKRFYALQACFREGLLKFASERREEFRGLRSGAS